jgi:hypothetical protein
MLMEPKPETIEILAFMERVGLPVRRERIEGKTFMPGVTIRGGELVVDEEELVYPGDMLHEAGHLALMTAEERAACDGDAGADAGAEMAAISWSYAAALEIGIDPVVVFHPHGYNGGGAAIIENFTAGRYFGVPLLQWHGMTTDPASRERPANAILYPKMKRWMRE